MSRRRFHAPVETFSGKQVDLAANEARHLRDVLRLGPGDEIYIFDGEGREFQCVIDEARRNRASLRVIAEVSPEKPESPLDLTLAVSLLKGERFDLVVQKATELGVARLQPVITQRAEVRLKDDHDTRRVTRWQRIAAEAARQSGRARVPEVAAPIAFGRLIEDYAEGFTPAAVERDAADGGAAIHGATLLMFSERDGQPLGDAPWPPLAISSVVALVGPEGGWTDQELEQARAAGWNIVTLGGRILRAETAAIAVAVLLQHRLGDLQ